MAVINHEAELARAGANITGWRSRILFFTRRYPLGAVGAVIVPSSCLTAVFADIIAPIDPDVDQRQVLARRAEQPVLAGRRLHGPRHVQPHRPRRAHLARRRRSAPWAWAALIGISDRPGQRLSRRLVRPHRAAPARHHAVAAAAGDGDRHGGRARTVAAEHHHRHRHPAGAERRPRRALVAPCRCASSRSSRRRAPSAWASCASRCAMSCPIRWRR